MGVCVNMGRQVDIYSSGNTEQAYTKRLILMNSDPYIITCIILNNVEVKLPYVNNIPCCLTPVKF